MIMTRSSAAAEKSRDVSRHWIFGWFEMSPLCCVSPY